MASNIISKHIIKKIKNQLLKIIFKILSVYLKKNLINSQVKKIIKTNFIILGKEFNGFRLKITFIMRLIKKKIKLKLFFFLKIFYFH